MTKNNDFAIRLAQAMKAKDVDITELCKAINVTYEMVRRYINAEAEPRKAKIEKIAQYLDVPAAWLQYGVLDQSDKKNHKKDTYTIDILNISASAGYGLMNNETIEVVRSIEYNSEQARMLFGGRSPENIKVINIKGDSMTGTFDAGDLAFVDTTINHFDSDGIYVFTFGKGLYVKRLQLIKDCLYVISDNKTYKDWAITEAEMSQLYIHGKVMMSQSMHLKKHG